MFLIYAGILAVQFFLSSRNNIYWGAILPVAHIVFLTCLFITNRIESTFDFILYLLLGMLFLWIEWNLGRKYFHKKIQKELDKIKTLDMQ